MLFWWRKIRTRNTRISDQYETVELDFSLHCPLQQVRSLATLTSCSQIPPWTPPLLQCWEPNSSLNCGAWKLTSEFFMIFLLIILVGQSSCSWGIWPLSRCGNLLRKATRKVKEFRPDPNPLQGQKLGKYTVTQEACYCKKFSWGMPLHVQTPEINLVAGVLHWNVIIALSA